MWTADDFDYDLDEKLIAQQPPLQRSGSRMMVLDRSSKMSSHDDFCSLPAFLKPGDLMIFNDTKVFPARLMGQKDSGGKVECLVERILSDNVVLAHVRSSKSPRQGGVLFFHGAHVEVLGRQGDLFKLRFDIDEGVLDFLNRHGRLPLPPYIQRDPTEADYNRYQTIMAQKTGAVAAPTAALHFDDEILNKIRSKGVEIETLTLHVGAGTFQPVRVDNLSSHHMHSEWIDVPQSLCQRIIDVKKKGGRVVAIGTTVMRALESVSRTGQPEPFSGETDIFIYPGFKFHCVDALLTNFHLPKSTLLMLVSAFAGYELMMQAYQSAIDESYRFFSYGDCMFIQ